MKMRWVIYPTRYHTFNELYRYRMLYNAAFFNELAKGDIKVCKSYRHYDGCVNVLEEDGLL